MCLPEVKYTSVKDALLIFRVRKNMYKCSTWLIDTESSVLALWILFFWQHFVLRLKAEKCLMHVLKLEGPLFRILIPFADNDVHSSFSCLHMHFYVFYDSSAYWTKRPFRAVRRSWQALPFPFTILLAYLLSGGLTIPPTYDCLWNPCVTLI